MQVGRLTAIEHQPAPAQHDNAGHSIDRMQSLERQVSGLIGCFMGEKTQYCSEYSEQSECREHSEHSEHDFDHSEISEY